MSNRKLLRHPIELPPGEIPSEFILRIKPKCDPAQSGSRLQLALMLIELAGFELLGCAPGPQYRVSKSPPVDAEESQINGEQHAE